MTRRGLIVGGAGLVTACGSRTSARSSASARRSATASSLPTPATDGPVSLQAALAGRRSIRSFGSAPLSREELGQLFWAAQGVTHGSGNRTAPSAGALYPLEVYAATRTLTLHYLPAGHRVEQWPAGTWSRLAAGTPSGAVVRAAAAVFVVTGVSRRTQVRYGDRADRYLLLEAGHCAQNLLLQAVCLGLGAVPIGAFDEGAVADYLALPTGEAPVYLIPVGRPAT